MAAPAWAPPYAQVPRPEHMRRGNGHAAPSSCEGYPIRCFLLTDSVAYAPLPIFHCAPWPGDGDFGGRSRGPLRPQDRPQVIHHGSRFCTATSPRFYLIILQNCAKNGGKVASGSVPSRTAAGLLGLQKTAQPAAAILTGTASAQRVAAGHRAHRSSQDE